MKIENNFILCTVEELAKLVVRGALDCESEEYKGYDFGLADYRDRKEDEDLECLASGVEGWYGIHSIDTGFDAYEMTLCCDYYGGGYYPQYVVIWDEMKIADVVQSVLGAILKVLDANEGATFSKDEMLICEKRK